MKPKINEFKLKTIAAMSKRIILFTGILISIVHSRAQVTFEHTYPGPNSLAQSRPTIINMGGNDGYKYMYVDFQSNELKLFNLDHTLFYNITVPVTLLNSSQYNIGYVTWSLFDCDTTQFEYAILPGNSSKTFSIYRQDGTLLFQRDSVIAPFCFGCYNGSYDIRPISSTPNGSKLFLYKADGGGQFHTTDVYSVCGKIPVQISEENTAVGRYIKVYPNPSSGKVDFEIDLPDNLHSYELSLYNSSLQLITSMQMEATKRREHFDGSILSSGNYFFALQAEGKILQSGKFVITK